jgi:hypothetical protein
MRKLIDEFVTQFIKKMNTIISTYYEEAPNDATYPYAVVPSLVINSIDYGYRAIIDVEFYVNDLSDSNIEELNDNLRNQLDQFTFYNNKVGFHINYDGSILSKQVEQDFTYRKATFIAKIF